MNSADLLELRRSWRVLIVDDDAAVRGALPAVLQGPRVEVETASNLVDAHRCLCHGVDLLITDLRLRDREDTDGFELVMWAHSRTPELPVVVLTAHGSSEMRAQAKRLGAVDLWIKTMSMDEIVGRIRSLGIPVSDGTTEGKQSCR